MAKRKFNLPILGKMKASTLIIVGVLLFLFNAAATAVASLILAPLAIPAGMVVGALSATMIVYGIYKYL